MNQVGCMQPALSPQAFEHKLDSEELEALISAAINDGYIASFKAPGSSMMPFIRSGDKIFVSRVDMHSIKRGDILVFVHPESSHVLAHRVVKLKSSRILCKGDNVPNLFDGWIFYEDVLGRVVRVQRERKQIKFGLGIEGKLLAYLSRKKLLVPLVNILGTVKWIVIGLFSPKSKTQS